MTSRSDTVLRWAILIGQLLTAFLLYVAHTRAQTAVTTTADLPAGTSYVVVRAFNTAGQHSGYSNEVRVVRDTAGATAFAWDANTEPDLAGYVLLWGAAPGVYTTSKTIAAVVPPGKLPVPTLRIRRAE